MKGTKKLVIANWKMHPKTVREAEKLFKGFKKIANKLRNVQTIVCPSFVHMGRLQKLVSGHRIVLGSQDVYFQKEGAFTGEISPVQLTDLGVYYVLVGHSERRRMGETDTIVNRKLKLCLKHRLTPILCIGETVRDPRGEYLSVIKEQLNASLKGIPKKEFKKIIVAYEPVWALSTTKGGHQETPGDMFQIHLYIRKCLMDIYKDTSLVKGTSILYGGSVTPNNVELFLREGGIQGVLVGGASLSQQEFTSILETAEEV